MRAAEPPATAGSPALLRLSGLLGALALLCLAALLSPARAPARRAIPRHGACTVSAKHLKHLARPSRCNRHTPHRSKPTAQRPVRQTRPTPGAAGRTSAGPAQTPALCEDASAPVRTSGGYLCTDGSEPACEASSEPATGPNGAPVCTSAGVTPPASEVCTTGAGECQTLESSCESVGGAAQGQGACEPSGGGE